MVEQPARAVEVFQACPLLAPGISAAAEESDPDDHMCMQCGLTFPSLAGVNCHIARAHPRLGDATVLKRYIGAWVCPCCGVAFRTMMRAIQHARPRVDCTNRCRNFILAGHVPLLCEDLLEALALEGSLHRRACRRKGLLVDCGSTPPAVVYRPSQGRCRCAA